MANGYGKREDQRVQRKPGVRYGASTPLRARDRQSSQSFYGDGPQAPSAYDISVAWSLSPLTRPPKRQTALETLRFLTVATNRMAIGWEHAGADPSSK